MSHEQAKTKYAVKQIYIDIMGWMMIEPKDNHHSPLQWATHIDKCKIDPLLKRYPDAYIYLFCDNPNFAPAPKKSVQADRNLARGMSSTVNSASNLNGMYSPETKVMLNKSQWKKVTESRLLKYEWAKYLMKTIVKLNRNSKVKLGGDDFEHGEADTVC